jgi:hypothetical protein
MARIINFIVLFFTMIYGLFVLIISIKNFKKILFVQKIVKYISDDPAYADQIMGKLHCLYGKFSISAFDDLFYYLSLIPENQIIGKYQILKTFKINENKMLCVTICNDLDHYVSITGDFIQTKRVYSFNFVIVRNLKKMQFEFYSEFYYGLNDKNLRSDFESELLNYIVKA